MPSRQKMIEMMCFGSSCNFTARWIRKPVRTITIATDNFTTSFNTTVVEMRYFSCRTCYKGDTRGEGDTSSSVESEREDAQWQWGVVYVIVADGSTVAHGETGELEEEEEEEEHI